MSFYDDNAISKRFYVLGFTASEFMPLVKAIRTWVSKSGECWTCDRLKDLRQMFLHWSFDLPYQASTRIERYADGTPKGAFRVMFRGGTKRFRKAWNALMVFSGFVSQKLTNKQWLKFIKGVERPLLEDEAALRVEAFIRLGFQQVTANMPSFPKPPEASGEPVERYPFREAKRKEAYPFGSVAESEAFWPSIQFVLTYGKGFLDQFPNISAGSLARFGYRQGTPRSRTALIGQIAVLQEPGYKARIIANPNIVYQQLLRPLYQWLRAVNERLPGNFQFDQAAGMQFVREQLSKGYSAVSVDASGWTDHFPRRYTLAAMRNFGVDQEWLTCYDLVSGGEWKVPEQSKGLKGNRITTYSDGTKALPNAERSHTRWRVGQPLGLIPTFNGATLAHVLLAMGIQTRCSDRPPTELTFAIVGDDIVWFEPECAEVYMELLDASGVPVSRDKTLVSDRAAEFCSSLITADGIYASPKWKQASDDSFVQLCRNLGPRSVALLSKRQRDVIRSIAPFPEPFGLGWNKGGIPYWDRQQILVNTLASKEHEVELKSLDLRSLSYWYNSSRLDHDAEYVSRDSLRSVPEQGPIEVFKDIFGFPVMPWLAVSLVEHVIVLSHACRDEALLHGQLSQETLHTLPRVLADRLDGLSGSAAIAELALVCTQLKRAIHASEQTDTVVSSKLQQLESLLLRTSLKLKGIELKQEHRRKR